MMIYKLHKTSKTLIYCILISLLLTHIQINDVKADAAPPGPPSGTNPFPTETGTNVRMVSETVIYNIISSTPYDKAKARVNASFTMRNLGDIDEQMDVRFPLDMSRDFFGVCHSPYLDFPLINDFAVSVDDQPVEVTYGNEQVGIRSGSNSNLTKTVPCWAIFPVTFPVNKDVIIETTFTVTPYINYLYEYSYVLITGNGWKDTIGSANIIFNVPYALNKFNFYNCSENGCIVSNNRVEWHYEDFDAIKNVSIDLVPPPLWQTILIETENTKQNPNDAESWGRLGKAYKESIRGSRGYALHNDGASFQRSKEAYQMAITLLPDDADWHFGFADLLCWDAEYYDYGWEYYPEVWQSCFEQIREVLRINPNHQKMKEYIQNNPFLSDQIDLKGLEPKLLYLTVSPTAVPTNTPNPTQTPKIIRATPMPGQ